MQAPTGFWASQFGTINWAAHGGFCLVTMAGAEKGVLPINYHCPAFGGNAGKNCLLVQPAGPSSNTALGFTRSTVRLLDVGHSSGTFLTDEFGYEVARTRLIWMCCLSIIFTFLIPLLLLVYPMQTAGPALSFVAMVSAFIGGFAERWLFFAEARHVASLYHGAQSTSPGPEQDLIYQPDSRFTEGGKSQDNHSRHV